MEEQLKRRVTVENIGDVEQVESQQRNTRNEVKHMVCLHAPQYQRKEDGRGRIRKVEEVEEQDEQEEKHLKSATGCKQTGDGGAATMQREDELTSSFELQNKVDASKTPLLA